ncbi:MAG TPA: hypothetical protein VEA16_16265 [Vicinamibacterales bacterium]|nr:hypothetical protein [Vicinamibacterales bacterium]
MNEVLTRALGVAVVCLLGGIFTPTGPRKPDFQGNWTNGTQTPLERIIASPTLTSEEVVVYEAAARRPWTGEMSYDPGLEVLRIGGEARSSIIVDPPDGRIPPLTDAGKRRVAELTARERKFGEFDHPEVRPLAERCLISFGPNAGPPMLPNYFYNNNYTIVQTADHVMFLAEMNHDARIVPIGRGSRLPPHIQPWFGDSHGRWEGATLVVETTNIRPAQVEQLSRRWPYRGASERLKVTERFTLSDRDTILYRFTLEDPEIFTTPFSGELVFKRSVEQVFEYACHEGDYSLASILSAARERERAAAARTKGP